MTLLPIVSYQVPSVTRCCSCPCVTWTTWWLTLTLTLSVSDTRSYGGGTGGSRSEGGGGRGGAGHLADGCRAAQETEGRNGAEVRQQHTVKPRSSYLSIQFETGLLFAVWTVTNHMKSDPQLIETTFGRCLSGNSRLVLTIFDGILHDETANVMPE